MKILSTKEKATEILAPYLPTMNRVMLESLEEINNAMNAVTVPLNNRAKCSTLHSIAIEKAQRYFSNTSEVFIKPKYQSIQLVFKSELVGRIKKVKDDKTPKNAKTKRNDRIIMHQLSLFPDTPDLTFIDLAYKINSTWTEYEWLVVLCRQNDKVLWEIDFKNVTTEIVMPKEEKEVLTTKEDKQIRVKKGKKAS